MSNIWFPLLCSQDIITIRSLKSPKKKFNEEVTHHLSTPWCQTLSYLCVYETYLHQSYSLQVRVYSLLSSFWDDWVILLSTDGIIEKVFVVSMVCIDSQKIRWVYRIIDLSGLLFHYHFSGKLLRLKPFFPMFFLCIRESIYAWISFIFHTKFDYRQWLKYLNYSDCLYSYFVFCFHIFHNISFPIHPIWNIRLVTITDLF